MLSGNESKKASEAQTSERSGAEYEPRDTQYLYTKKTGTITHKIYR
jgi:hypothetical protein